MPKSQSIFSISVPMFSHVFSLQVGDKMCLMSSSVSERRGIGVCAILLNSRELWPLVPPRILWRSEILLGCLFPQIQCNNKWKLKSYPRIPKGVSATSQSGRYTLSYTRTTSFHFNWALIDVCFWTSRRRWASIKSTLVQPLVFVGLYIIIMINLSNIIAWCTW